MILSERLKLKVDKEISTCSNEEIYFALLELVQELSEERINSNQSKKKLYYISAEFLIGKLLSNNLINLGIYDNIKEILEENGKNISEIEEIEPEPSLGNGGLGRLAACFLDSIATLGIAGDGIGLNYHFGLFKQVFNNNLQMEEKNEWIDKISWLNETDVTYDIEFEDFTLTSRLYDINVTGYNNQTNKLHLFDVETVDENIVKNGINFDKEDIEKNLTLFLYPDDSDEKGRLLRIYQQYFMVSNGARYILDECISKGSNLHDLAEYAVIQINDTHPTMVIPELIRLLMEKGIELNEAIEIVTNTCAYTNHTILAEALEKWPIKYLEKVVPNLIPIIKELDKRVRNKYEDESVYIIDENENVHMAHIDIHYTFSVNGVASLHTDILKNNELNNFYKIYPEKFNNKTNGITFRRWLLHCNPLLADLIEDLIGDGFKEDADKLQDLIKYVDDENVLKEILNIKDINKIELKKYLKQVQGID
ncbi:MAG: glycogen/starch/alpha-glucan phosphorylase, partial [Peptostreptococcaceae bacterium]